MGLRLLAIEGTIREPGPADEHGTGIQEAPAASRQHRASFGSTGGAWDGCLNPKEMIDSLHRLYNMKLMISIWPQVDSSTAVLRDLAAAGHLFPTPIWNGGKTYRCLQQRGARHLLGTPEQRALCAWRRRMVGGCHGAGLEMVRQLAGGKGGERHERDDGDRDILTLSQPLCAHDNHRDLREPAQDEPRKKGRDAYPLRFCRPAAQFDGRLVR